MHIDFITKIKTKENFDKSLHLIGLKWYNIFISITHQVVDKLFLFNTTMSKLLLY